VLLKLSLVVQLEVLLQAMYVFFFHSFKKLWNNCVVIYW
jgi:hypothetical protein